MSILVDSSNRLEFNALTWYEHDEVINYQKKYSILVFGRLLNGESITVKIENYLPHFYVKIPEFGSSVLNTKHSKKVENLNWSDRKIASMFTAIKSKLKHSANDLVSYEIVTKSDLFYGFCNGQQFRFMRLIFKSMKAFHDTKKNLYSSVFVDREPYKFVTMEGKIDPYVRCIHEMDVSSTGWIVVDADKYQYVAAPNSATTKHFVTVNSSEIKPYIGPIRPLSQIVVMSYDIECTSPDGSFPQATRLSDKIISIGSTFSYYNSKEIFKKHVISLGTCDPIDGVEVEEYETEREVLLAWKNLVIREDPDIITGYNIKWFDNEYMYIRAKLDEINCLDEFSQLSRIKGHRCEFKEVNLSSSGLGDNILKQFMIIGRSEIDLMKMVQQDHKLESYKLDNVAEVMMRQTVSKIDLNVMDKNGTRKYVYTLYTKLENIEQGTFVRIMEDGFADEEDKYKVENVQMDKQCFDLTFDVEYFRRIGEGNKINVKVSPVKDDMPPQEIFRTYPLGPEYRARINKYCIQDCALVSQILCKLQIVNNRMAMAKVSHVPFDYILTRGQGIKALSLFAKHCRKVNYLIMDKGKADGNDDGYQGAIVFEAKKKYYKVPICVLDFNSLYPSVEIAYDMSPENLHKNSHIVPDDRYFTRTIEYVVEDKEKKEKENKEKKKKKDTTDEDNGISVISTGGSAASSVSEERIATATFVSEKSKLDSSGKQVSHGILGTILKDLLSERKKAKKAMAAATDDFIREIYNGEQLALKITANSIYGQLGAPVSPIFCKEIAAATTAGGRSLLIQAKDYVEQDFVPITTKIYKLIKTNKVSKLDNYLKEQLEDMSQKDLVCQTIVELYDKYVINPEVIYGDTDSNFYNLKIAHKETPTQLLTDREARVMAIKIGIIISKLMKIHLRHPNNMDYEKVIQPCSLMEKKRYLGNKYEENPDKYTRLIMGYSLKRRGNSTIVYKIIGKAIEMVLDDNDEVGAEQFIKKSFEDIANGKFHISDFIISKNLKSKYKGLKLTTDKHGEAGTEGEWFWDDCKVSAAHVTLAQRMKKRDPGSAPEINTRVPYVMVAVEKQKNETLLQGDKIENPKFILENNLKIDYLFYITNQIKNSLIQFFELIEDSNISNIVHEIEKYELMRRDEHFFNESNKNILQSLVNMGVSATKARENDFSENDTLGSSSSDSNWADFLSQDSKPKVNSNILSLLGVGTNGTSKTSTSKKSTSKTSTSTLVQQKHKDIFDVDLYIQEIRSELF